MTVNHSDEYRASLERELIELRKQFSAGLIADHDSELPDRLEAIRRRMAEIKAKLAHMASE